ncbi:hypothetical protein EJ02DRAFT_441113 [Clathrospora elynae]|uniref:chitinase n=1 Tax=Clathrospora elynae TaxID=706981 RepID=A0A6A5TC45_9PLEO|nr:hypothetical protein EJ02DRAFT_441113 [Clathrospora elynae]
MRGVVVQRRKYPQDTTQGAQFLALLKEIRFALDTYAETLIYGDDSGHKTKPHLLLSIATPAGESNYQNIPLGEIGATVITAYLSAGEPAFKLNLGMPLYGRDFTNTGTWEAGVYDLKDLPLVGVNEYYDAEAQATYSYDNSTGMLISYDTVGIALTKVDYIVQEKLGGAMCILSNSGGSSGFGIESSNWLMYPDSQFDNIKSGAVYEQSPPQT